MGTEFPGGTAEFPGNTGFWEEQLQGIPCPSTSPNPRVFEEILGLFDLGKILICDPRGVFPHSPLFLELCKAPSSMKNPGKTGKNPSQGSKTTKKNYYFPPLNPGNAGPPEILGPFWGPIGFPLGFPSFFWDGDIPEDPGPPEEALAALAGHGVEVEAGGSVPADPTDPGNVPLGISSGIRQGGAGSTWIHGWEGEKTGICHENSGFFF